MKLLALDCETTFIDLGQDRKCRDAFNVPDLVCCQMWDGNPRQGGVWEWDHNYLRKVLARHLTGEIDCIIVGHNIPFDVLTLCKQFPSLEPLWRRAINEGRVLDTMVLAHLREPCVKSKSLANLVKYHLKKDLSGKGDTQLSFTREQPLTEEQREYALNDAKVTLELANHLRELPLGSVYRGENIQRHQMECEENHQLPEGKAGFHPLDHVYSSCFVNTRCWSEPIGWDLDMEKFEKHRTAGLEKIETHAKELHKHELIRRVRDTSDPFTEAPFSTTHWPKKWTYDSETDTFQRNIKGVSQVQPAKWQLDNKAIRGALYEVVEELDLKDYPVSEKTKKISMKYDYWKLYRKDLPSGLQAFLDYSKAQKYESIYFKNWETSRTGRVYPTYHIPGTETLRHASSKPNLQQISKSLREIFHVKDHVIVGADYSALECYTLCHTLCNLNLRGPLYETLAAGGDMHSITAARMLGGDRQAYGKGTSERQAAKALNFGIPGGLGVKKMHAHGRSNYGLDWTRGEAEELYYAWLEAYPDVAEYLQRFRDKGSWQLKPKGLKPREWWESLGFYEKPSTWDLTMSLDKGRIYDVDLPSGARLPARNYTQGTNCAFQHLGAVATSHAVNLCFAAELPVIGAVHDAIALAIPAGPAGEGGRHRSQHWYKRKLEECMEQALHETCPLAPRQKVEAEIHETFF